MREFHFRPEAAPAQHVPPPTSLVRPRVPEPLQPPPPAGAVPEYPSLLPDQPPCRGATSAFRQDDETGSAGGSSDENNLSEHGARPPKVRSFWGTSSAVAAAVNFNNPSTEALSDEGKGCDSCEVDACTKLRWENEKLVRDLRRVKRRSRAYRWQEEELEDRLGRQYYVSAVLRWGCIRQREKGESVVGHDEQLRAPGGAAVDNNTHCGASAGGHWTESSGRGICCAVSLPHPVTVASRLNVVKPGSTPLRAEERRWSLPREDTSLWLAIALFCSRLWFRCVKRVHGTFGRQYRWGVEFSYTSLLANSRTHPPCPRWLRVCSEQLVFQTEQMVHRLSSPLLALSILALCFVLCCSCVCSW